MSKSFKLKWKQENRLRLARHKKIYKILSIYHLCSNSWEIQNNLWNLDHNLDLNYTIHIPRQSTKPKLHKPYSYAITCNHTIHYPTPSTRSQSHNPCPNTINQITITKSMPQHHQPDPNNIIHAPTPSTRSQSHNPCPNTINQIPIT